MELPPILPPTSHVLMSYIKCIQNLPMHQDENNQQFWKHTFDANSLFHCDSAPISSTLKVVRDHDTGKILEFNEVPIEGVGSNPKNSYSLNRAPAQPTDSVKGEPLNFPFWPAAFPDCTTQLLTDNDFDFSELLTIPPGFDRGLQFKGDCHSVIDISDDTVVPVSKTYFFDDDTQNVNVMKLLDKEVAGLWKQDDEEEKKQEVVNVEIEAEVLPIDIDIPVLKISEPVKPKPKKNLEWAVALDSKENITDFHVRIPEMAFEYNFELDTFQKQAVLKLEENFDVFVAAHTSAGKTVVAEYAIALSQKHQTRTIYTSPIKALSNQKYRDFKKTFNDVGLITGDIQINQTGSCLIMTTEILRTMLYCGSEVTRDLEFVIFDEVHYINDRERGHVWEEVIILLPAHVRIVMLSATVPNTMEFANWIGCTKQRIVYVISTLKRPVPLQHYLYTGTDGKSRDQRYLLIDDKGKFLDEGYLAAMRSITQKKFKMGSDQHFWVTLVDHLKRNDLLPAVIFTFSRNKCDMNARKLLSTDMTTAREKGKIVGFFNQCINVLKAPDRELPQVQMMGELLKNGIGVHHSGILPILKEIIEILFQKGLIKILFATETFAMGVNMPAKTVVFENIIKYDGKERRPLKPAEYIQMAGRAGRRGLDKTGTVILRVAPDQVQYFLESTLKCMMQGEPQHLESQFRLTYRMLLSLLRCESLDVELMMEKSFSEIKHVQNSDKLKTAIKKTELEYATESNTELGEHQQQLILFYNAAKDFIDDWKRVQPQIVSYPKVTKYLTPGRIVVVNHKHPQNKLGLLLSVKLGGYKVLVLDDQKPESHNVNITLSDAETSTETKDKHEEYLWEWYRMLSFTQQLYQPVGIGGHQVIVIPPEDIIEIITKTIKLDENLVIKDWDQRQIPRFRDNPVGQTCQQAIQNLFKLNQTMSENFIEECCHPISDLSVNDLELVDSIIKLYEKRSKIATHLGATKIANFEEQFSIVFKKKYLENKLEVLKFQNSMRSLVLYPEYEKRIQLLNNLKYIDNHKKVELKGKVACQMSMNELLITELVFRNELKILEPAEVAALLSVLVLQISSREDKELKFPDLPKNLTDAIKRMRDLIAEIEQYESQYQIVNEGEYRNFELTAVVYEWAKQEPFAKIMKATEFQEGIVVRCIQQLHDLLKDVRDAAKLFGDNVLQAKMDEAMNLIKRDIVFTASLYIQKEIASF